MKDIFTNPLKKSDYEAIMQGVREARITAWWDRAVDIIPKTGGKGAAIGKILEYYHFAKEEAMAFGDSRRAPAGNCGGSPFEII